MSMIERVCETCVYCTFSGNCDRYSRPLTDIEMPACSGHEVHPLLAENAKLKRENKKLRELCKYMKRSLCETDPVDNPCDLYGGWDSGLNVCAYELQMSELGIEV